MRRTRRRTGVAAKAAGTESGFALLLALFMVASLILLAAIATPRILTQGRREKEQEAIWRGNQYMRAIRLYYRKNGRYPQTLDDLKKPDNVGNHYLRKPYADPMNPADGAWRVIYVTPSGQLVGSVHYHSLQEMALDLLPGFQAATGSGAAQTAQAQQQGSAQAGPQTGQPSGTPAAASQAAATPSPITNQAPNQNGGQNSGKIPAKVLAQTSASRPIKLPAWVPTRQIRVLPARDLARLNQHRWRPWKPWMGPSWAVSLSV